MRRSSVKKAITVMVFILAAAVLLSACGYTVVDTDRIGDFEATFERAYNETVLDTARDGESFDMKATVSEDGGELVGYSAKCIEELPLGESVQILLSVKYDDEAFAKETERISQLSSSKPVLYDTEHFKYPAYVSTVGYLNVCEYVLVDEENLTLHNVVLQSVKPEDVAFDASYLPSGYRDYGAVDGLEYTVYSYFD